MAREDRSRRYAGSMPKATEPEYIIDGYGRRTKVMLSIETYEELLEDLHDLRLAAERHQEESVPWDEVTAELDRDAS